MKTQKENSPLLHLAKVILANNFSEIDDAFSGQILELK